MDTERWRATGEYSLEVFGKQDDHLEGLMKEAVARGMPDIAVSSDVGRLLMLLASTTPGRLALELGTLAGYSGVWIARGLAPDGRLITIETEETHAAFARAQFERAGVSDRVEVRLGAALDILPELIGELTPASVDVVFIDAIKIEYPQYFELLRPLVSVGGMVIADNVYGSDEWRIDRTDDPTAAAMDRFNRMVADDPDFEAVAVPIRAGVLIARRMR